jgi:hypothetical protein
VPGIHTVVLEILRPGPPHNQLLSPLTLYMALCGEGSPVTFRINFEHHQLLNRLERLRYVSDGGAAAVPERMRQAEVQELGAEVAKILAEIPTLTAEISEASGSRPQLIHLRLALSGSELALIPFELANAPQGFPGERIELQLQASAPITLTREIRRGRPLPVEWNRPPRILFAFAAPGGTTVPYREHTHALRMALEPWIKQAPVPEQRLPLIKEHLTVLPQASLEQIRRACAAGDYTHVHVLAHGVAYQQAGEQRFGVALCDEFAQSRPEIVEGKRLAQALRAVRADGRGQSAPAVVTLAICDSGAAGSVLVPGGSIAHDLHAAGIPWVIASQFPLTKIGSVAAVEVLYTRLLLGDDPRLVLQDLRQRLFTAASTNHDWGSIVAYASLPEGFDRQVNQFRERQMREAINVAFDWAAQQQDLDQMERALAVADQHLARWRALLPSDDSLPSREFKAECYGLHGASQKRKAELYHRRGAEEKACQALQAARAEYAKAMETGTQSHWTATQYLSLTAVLREKPEPELWAAARWWAANDLRRADAPTQAWAHGSLAELDLLGVYHQKPFAAKKAAAAIAEHCEEIVALMGRDSFHVLSTERQFRRYLDWWDRPEWRELAQAAVDALRGSASQPEAASQR